MLLISASGQVDVAILTTGHDVADARLHRLVDAMTRADLRVEVLGLGDPEGGPDGALVRSCRRAGLLARSWRALVLPWRSAAPVLVTLDPDVAITVGVIGRLRRRSVVADVHEDYRAMLADRAWARGPVGVLAAGLVALADLVVARADLTVVADHHLPPKAERCRERLVVRNTPDLTHVLGTSTPDPLERGDERVPQRVVYVGDVRESRGLHMMLDTIAGAPGWTLDLVGPVAEADVPWLTDRLGAPDVQGRVRLHGRLPPVQAWQIGRRAQVGMVLLQSTPAFDDALPSKLLEYLAAGLAVIATPLPRVSAVLRDSLAGVVVDDAVAAAAALKAWHQDPEDLRRAQRAALAYMVGRNEPRSGYDHLAGRLAGLAGAQAASS